jgi:general secretion pathway protein G
MNPFHISASRWRTLRCRGRCTRRGFCAAGFSLLEMMIVITIILILASIAAGRYEKSVLLDKEAGPSSLDDLVQSKYLSGIPTDPITRNKDWKTESEQVLLDPLQTNPGITDVHSTSEQVSPFENTAYNTW